MCTVKCSNFDTFSAQNTIFSQNILKRTHFFIEWLSKLMSPMLFNSKIDLPTAGASFFYANSPLFIHMLVDFKAQFFNFDTQKYFLKIPETHPKYKTLRKSL